ncbi:hypothetical protein ZWY2020_040164 [Hordeum vulgare]|nr:hypothetical protein ZWY2020_040164 [Hordeum vulgare]
MLLHPALNRQRTTSPPPSTATCSTPAPPLRRGSPRTIVDLRSPHVAACHGSPRGAPGPRLLEHHLRLSVPMRTRVSSSGSSSRALPPGHGSPNAAAYLPWLFATTFVAFPHGLAATLPSNCSQPASPTYHRSGSSPACCEVCLSFLPCSPSCAAVHASTCGCSPAHRGSR